MYHSISDDPEPGVRPYFRVCTSPRRFAEHMQWLADAGFCGVTLSAGLAALASEAARAKGEGGAVPESQIAGQRSQVGGEKSAPADTCDLGPGTLDASPDRSGPSTFDLGPETSGPSHSHLHSHSRPAKLVAITFDDGFRDFHTAAFPILQKHGFSATVYLPTAFIDESRKQFKTRECLTWSEIVDLRSAGVEFGSHTVNHPVLVELTWQQIEAELRTSKSTIESRLAAPVLSFAYPFAFPGTIRSFVEDLRGLLRKAGYESCLTTEIGVVSPGVDTFRLKRLPVNERDDLALFTAKLDGKYNWVRFPQRFSKSIKTQLRKCSSLSVSPRSL
jgi:peptidoglycan/xylan/chitin deacetylase (PgdA/CDA1 family)